MPIFTRLVSNENHWIVPSGHPWTAENQEREDIFFEHRYGFAHEEWLFNTRYHVGGYQYGHIRGLYQYHQPGNRIDRTYLYAVKEDQSYYIGYIDDIELVGDQWRARYPAVADMYDGYEPVVYQEIREVKGDPSGLDVHEFVPVIQFKIANAALAPFPIPMPDFPLERYPGYEAYAITPGIQHLFDRHS